MSKWKVNKTKTSIFRLDESLIDDLHRQLSAKDDLLTETRLEALTSASQLQALREQVAKLRSELQGVKKENEDLKHSLSTPSKVIHPQKEWTQSSLILDSSTLNIFDESLEIPLIIVINSVPSPMEIRIGSIRLRKNENLGEVKPWKDLDMNISCLFGLYLARLDPFECLGLSQDTSIHSYEFMGRSRKMVGHFEFIDDPEEENANPSYIASHTRILLKLRPLDELSFASLRPILNLRPFIERIQNSSLGWIQGPKGSGKTFLAKRFAEYLVKSKRRVDEAICYLTYKEDELGRIFDNLSLRARVVILDDIEDPENFNNVALNYLAQLPNVTFLCITQSQKPLNSSLSLFNNSKLEASFLGYLLRRRVLSIETLTFKANDPMIVAVNWLNRVHVQLSDFCARNCLEMPSLKYFLIKDLPLESSHQFRLWFVDLWNLVLVEAFKKQNTKIQEDPVQIIARTWPWKDQDGGLCQALRPLSSKKGENDDIFNKDPLVS